MATDLSQHLLTSINNPFYMTLTGCLELIEGSNSANLVCADQTQFPVSRKFNDPTLIDTSVQQWEVVPSITTTGIISTIQLVKKVVTDENPQPDTCEVVGRVVQLGKRNASALLKVNRPPLKTLRLALLSPLPEMKVGQLWQVVARREGNTLQIEYAVPVDEDANLVEDLLVTAPPATESVEPQVKISEPPTTIVESVPEPESDDPSASLLALAQQALEEASEVSGWRLFEPKQRKKLWEWEAIREGMSETQKIKARVRVNSVTKETEVFPYYEGLFLDSQITTRQYDQTLSDRLIVTPLGAARGIGASCFRVEIGPYEIVLDAGTRPKGSNPLPAFEHLHNPNLILISHAHQDHIGALPIFHRRFPGTRMISTPGTREIAYVMLTDCLKVQQSNEDFDQLFDYYDLHETLFRLETQPVAKDFEPLPGLTVRFIHAGHILGAACIYIRYGERSLLYTGDYNTTSSRTTEGLKLQDLPQADILITECTYGADVHPSRKAQENELLQAVAEVVQAGGNVLIPAFALGRAQEILLAIRTSALFHNLKIPVYVDGLVRSVTDVFRDNMNLLPTSVQNFAKQSGQEPFFNPSSTPPIIPIAYPRERPLAIAKPSVVIASSGMLTGGASVYYGQALLERDNAAIFISGYTDEESPGRFLQSLQKGETVEVDGKSLTVRATVRRFNLSAHADKVGLTQVIHRVNPRHLVLIHGSNNALHELARTGDLKDKYYIHIPEVGEQIEYGNVPGKLSQHQLARIESVQEFEVAVEAEIEGAWLRIPEEVLDDPRWQILSATGMLKAKWTGVGLQLSPISHHALAIESAQASGEDCCAVCHFFERKTCQSPESPLYTRRVDPSASCFEFQRATKFSDDILTTASEEEEFDYIADNV